MNNKMFGNLRRKLVVQRQTLSPTC